MKKFYPFIPILGLFLMPIEEHKNGPAEMNMQNEYVFLSSAILQALSCIILLQYLIY